MGIRDKGWARRSGKGFFIHSSRIRVGPWGNARTEITDEMIRIRALSLVTRGQLSPVFGLLSADGEWFELIDGELRLLAWRYAKNEMGVDLDLTLGGMYCELQEGFVGKFPTTREALLLQVSYGTNSESLSQYDKARAVTKLVQAGEEVTTIAIAMHCCEQQVRNMLAMDSVPEVVKKAVKPTTAVRFARADVPTKQKIVKKIEAGEKVKGRDVPYKYETADRTHQETVPVVLPEKHKMSDDEIHEQIDKASRLMDREKKEKIRFGWQQYKRALMSVIGEELPL
jgi:hypothetical protein